MCLTHVDFTKKGRSEKVLIGYKLFRPNLTKPGHLGFQFFLHDGNRRVKRGKWLVARRERVIGGNKSYWTGFHIYKHEREAKFARWTEEIVVKVKYKGVLAEGLQSMHTTVVAKYMYVPRPKRK